MRPLSIVFCEIFAKNSIVTFDLDLMSKVISPNESPYMSSYMADTNEACLYLSYFVRYLQKKASVTFDLDLRSKIISPNESPYMISYMVDEHEASIYHNVRYLEKKL